ncbi:MAG: hypothetical protein OES57_04615 [Acidimicrobiia bacterium]|nr:hypothetical protein [Acidimicrobiia bacterium]
MNDDADRAARRLGAAANLAHGFVYFAPEAVQAFAALGLGDDQQYFAGRAAPMGAVPASVVEAIFFNFAPHRVRAAIPSAWTVAEPATVQQARFDAIAAVFERSGGVGLDAAELTELATLSERLVDGAGTAGRPLAAANREVAPPEDAAVQAWQWATICREWRGDAHVAVLVATPVTPLEALVLHAATGKVPVAALRDTRGWTDDQWSATVEELRTRGLTTADGAFTEEGRVFRSAIERGTDTACRAMVDALGPTDTDRLIELFDRMGQHLRAAGLYDAYL